MTAIAKNSVVTLHVVCFDAEHNLLPDTVGETSYLHGYDDIFEKMQAALEGKQVGDKIEVTLTPAEAHGEIEEGLVFKEPVSVLPQGVAVGTVLEGENAAGEVSLYRVVAIEGDEAVLDGNHPLAGMALVVHAEVLGIREATDDEVSMGTLYPFD